MDATHTAGLAGAAAALAFAAAPAALAEDFCWHQPGEAAEVYALSLEHRGGGLYCLALPAISGATCWELEACNGDACTLSENGPLCSRHPADVDGDGGISLADLGLVLDALLATW